MASGKKTTAVEPLRHPRRIVILVAALSVPAVLIAAQVYAGYRIRGIPIAFLAALAIQLCHWEIWAIAGPFVWHLAERWPITPGDRTRALLRHVAAAPLVATAVLALNLVAYHILIRVPGVSGWFSGFDRSVKVSALIYTISYFHLELLVYCAIVAVAHAVRTSALLRAREHEALRLQAELTGARLTALRTQLQPHFLFNTLHTIGSLVLQRQNERAVQLLAELGELLRSTLAHRDTDLAPLGDEIAYLRRYVRIEEARFADRLQVQWNIEPAVMDALIPPFILQPVVENAFRHGISRRAEDSILSIAAAADNGVLRITVYNDGPALANSFSVEAGNGYGLKNVVERLRTRNPAGRFELENATGGVRATLTLPFWTASRVRTVG